MRPCPPPCAEPSTPVLKLPVNACDTHCHVFGPAAQFPFSATRKYTPADAPKETLFALHKRLGITRAVIVQASCHGTDNRAMLDALKARPDRLRGIGHLPLDTTTKEIAALDKAGMRGTRINFMTRLAPLPDLDKVDKLLARMAPFGWHVVLHFDPEEIAGLSNWLASLPVPFVIDHMARLLASHHAGPYHQTLCKIMENSNAWVKISGAERGSLTGAPWDDMVPIAQDLVSIAPKRTLWGTDWPHPVLAQPMPDDGKLVDLLAKMVPDEATRHAILVDNPARLYRF